MLQHTGTCIYHQTIRCEPYEIIRKSKVKKPWGKWRNSGPQHYLLCSQCLLLSSSPGLLKHYRLFSKRLIRYAPVSWFVNQTKKNRTVYSTMFHPESIGTNHLQPIKTNRLKPNFRTSWVTMCHSVSEVKDKTAH